MPFDVLVIVFLVALGVLPFLNSEIANLNNSVIVKEHPLKLNFTAAISNLTILLKLETPQLEFTAIRPQENCFGSVFKYSMSGCETTMKWDDAQALVIANRYVDAIAEFIRIRVTETNITAYYHQSGIEKTEVLRVDKSPKLCFLSAKKSGAKYEVDFTVIKTNYTPSCHEVLIQFTDDAKLLLSSSLWTFFAQLRTTTKILLILAVIVVVIVLLCLYYCYCRKMVFWRKKQVAEAKDSRRRSKDGKKFDENTTATVGSSFEDEDPNLKFALFAKPTSAKVKAGKSGRQAKQSQSKQGSSTVTDGDKSFAQSVPSQMWDVNKNVRAGPFNPEVKFDRMIDYTSKRPPIETIDFHCEKNIVMLREPGKKMYKWNVEIDNRSNAWASFIVRHGLQHMRSGEGADCVTQGKHSLVQFVRNLEPWQGWELVVFQMKQFPVRRWGGLPFSENVEYFHRFEHGTRDLFVYITEMMSEEDTAKFYAARLEERRAMLRPEDRDSLRKTFQVLIAEEANETDIQNCLSKM